jgi:hypothetical protein
MHSQILRQKVWPFLHRMREIDWMAEESYIVNTELHYLEEWLVMEMGGGGVGTGQTRQSICGGERGGGQQVKQTGQLCT